MTLVQSDTDRVDTLVDQLLADCPPKETDATKFLGEQFDRGLAWVHFADGEGGLGLSPALQTRATARLIEGGAPSAAMRNVIGYGMVAPTIAVHGTEDQ
ncbi:MAG: acyl-CoA dehydrogenase family protein, partial [Acidimicrobiales bacterium]